MIVHTRTANQLFRAMVDSAHKQGKGSPHMLERTIIGIDPGETTGLCIRNPTDDPFKIHMTQIMTQDRNKGMDNLIDAINSLAKWINPIIVCEDYRVYAAKTDQHAWAGLHTAKLIGHIERYAWLKGIPCVYPMAAEAKSFADDANLKRWDLYEPGAKHARDASRHVVTRVFFGQDPL